MAKHPLDEQLNLDPSSDVEEIFGMNLTLPDNPNMTTVVNLALQQYKDLVENARLLEPQDRVEILTLAKDFLDLAKDTMYRESDLAIKSRKNDIQEKKIQPKDLPNPQGGEEETPSLSYDDVIDEVNEARKKQKA